MDNYQIADAFSLLAKLMDIHGENSFKAKSYSSAAFAIEKLPLQLIDTPKEKFAGLKGIGDSSAKKIIELLETGSLKALEDIIAKTPSGVLEMMNIKGIGPKKIATIWKEMEIESIGELLYACEENRLKLYKGFGEKTQQNVIDTIQFYLKSKGNYLFSQVEATAEELFLFINKVFLNTKIELVGAYKRQLPVINKLDVVIDASLAQIEKTIDSINDFILIEKNSDDILYRFGQGLQIHFYGCDTKPFMKQVFEKNSSEAFAASFNEQFASVDYTTCTTEEDVFKQVNINFIPACQREETSTIALAQQKTLPALLQPTDVKGIIHSHSNWSDGSNTIEEMAKAAISKGFEYLVISDHSKSAFYANGLNEQRLAEQHLYVDELNAKLAPFKIFKSVESDILNDGNLDYSPAVLSTFDLVIASVHSNLKMTEEKAMSRLITAIENPYTTILGHMTGRLLLSRKGYPVDHKKIVDACAANNVVIELNAHPSRLDIDWQYIHYALEKGVLISIDPDAHVLDGFNDIRFGVLVAQKALVTKEQNLSSFSRDAFNNFLAERKKLKNI